MRPAARPVGQRLLRTGAALVAAGLLAPGLTPASPAIGAPSIGTAVSASEDTVPPGLERIDRRGTEADPVPVPTGRYYDTLPGPDESQFLSFERTVDDSWLFYGVTLLDPDLSPAEGLPPRPVLRLRTEDGVACGRSQVDLTSRGAVMAGLSQSGASTEDKACREADALRLELVGSPKVDQGTPIEVTVYELPPAIDASDLSVRADSLVDPLTIGRPTKSLAPGATRAEASLLTPNQPVHVDLPAGRVAWFALTDVELARYVLAYAQVADPSGELGGRRVEIVLYSPVGGIGSVIRTDFGGGDLNQAAAASLGSTPNTIQAHSWWLSAGVLNDTDGEAPERMSALPGTWYVAMAVSGAPDEGLPPVQVTLTGTLSRNNGPGDYVPDRTELAATPPTLEPPDGARPKPWKAPAPTEPSSPETEESPSGSAAGASGDGAGDPTPWGAVWTLFGAAALSTAAGAVLWRRRLG